MRILMRSGGTRRRFFGRHVPIISCCVHTSCLQIYSSIRSLTRRRKRLRAKTRRTNKEDIWASYKTARNEVTGSL